MTEPLVRYRVTPDKTSKLQQFKAAARRAGRGSGRGEQGWGRGAGGGAEPGVLQESPRLRRLAHGLRVSESESTFPGLGRPWRPRPASQPCRVVLQWVWPQCMQFAPTFPRAKAVPLFFSLYPGLFDPSRNFFLGIPHIRPLSLQPSFVPGEQKREEAAEFWKKGLS